MTNDGADTHSPFLRLAYPANEDYGTLRLADVALVKAEAEQAIRHGVRVLRESHGASWEDIGHALGISRQAAQQRYGRKA